MQEYCGFARDTKLINDDDSIKCKQNYQIQTGIETLPNINIEIWTINFKNPDRKYSLRQDT